MAGIFNLLSMGYSGAKGAVGLADFGYKGLAIGGTMGLASDYAGGKIAGTVDEDESGVGHQAIKGLVAGSLISGVSSTQELYAFQNPMSLQAISSINSTTTIAAEHDYLSHLTSPSAMKKTFTDAWDASSVFDDPLMRTQNAALDFQKTLLNHKITPRSFLTEGAKQSALTDEPISKLLSPIIKAGTEQQLNKAGFASRLEYINDSALDRTKTFMRSASEKEIESVINTGILPSIDEEDIEAVMNLGKLPTGEVNINQALNDMYAMERRKGYNPLKVSELSTITALKDSMLGLEGDNHAQKMQNFFKSDENYDIYKNYIKSLQTGNGITPYSGGRIMQDRVQEAGRGISTNMYENLRDTVQAAEKGSESKMLGGTGTIEARPVSVFGKQFNLKEVNVTDNMEMTERLGTVIERNSEIIDMALGLYNEGLDKQGYSGDRLRSAAEYKEYLSNIEPGAYGTFKEMQRKGVYERGSSIKSKTLGLMLEQRSGSPLWARALDADLNHKDDRKRAQIKKQITLKNAAGKTRVTEAFDAKTISRLDGEEIVNITNKIIGGNKLRRGAALAGDAVVGGLGTAAMFAIPAVIGKMFNDDKSGNDPTRDKENAKKVLRRG